jgi:GNAT superfamily N-acetyltransferase
MNQTHMESHMNQINANLLTATDPRLHLRIGTEADTELILELITALAHYEKLAREVTATAETLQQSLFGSRQVAEVVIAEYDGEAVGFALFFHSFSTFLGKSGIYLEDLFVKPDLRGKGVGKELLSCLARIAIDRGCGRFEWSVLDWNEPAIGFYRALGAQSLDGWTTFRLDGEALVEVARIGKQP